MSISRSRDDDHGGREPDSRFDPEATRTASTEGPDDSGTGLVSGGTFGPYRLEHLLGSGGFAEVWKVTRLDDGRTMALKILRGVGPVDPQTVARFEQEGRLAAALSHPRTVYVYSADVIDGVPTIAMELIGGGTLRDRVKRDGALPPVETVDLALDVLEGLEAAHRLGILHRDIKPANCFLDDDGRARLGDFGISRSLTLDPHLTVTGSFVGTPAFAAPEQIRGLAIDIRTDIYGIGALLYTLLAGREPFAAATGGDLMAKVLADPPPPLDRAVPRGLRRVVERTLRKDAARRPADCASLRRALAPYSSRELKPANPIRRFAAILIDSIFLGAAALGASLAIAVSGAGSWSARIEGISEAPALRLIELTVTIVYFALFEWLGSQTPGKRLMGLYVRGRDGFPGLAAVSLRVVVYAGFPAVLGEAAHVALGWDPGGAAIVGYLALLTTMRRSNGWRGIHELASGTRVVAVRTHLARVTVSAPSTEEAAPAAAAGAAVGPYRLRRELWRDGERALHLGDDPALGRQVWVLIGDASTTMQPERAVRLRWLRGGRVDGEVWNAFEAPSGESSRDRIARTGPAGWDEARSWLVGLVEEFAVSTESGALPEKLSIDRVWIDANGSVKLLPFPVTPPVNEAETYAGTSWPQFLHHFAIATLGGRSIPEHARQIVATLAELSSDVAAARRLEERLAASGERATTVGRRQRARHLVYTYGLIWLVAGLISLAGVVSEQGRNALVLVANGFVQVVLPFALLSIAAAFVTRGGPAMHAFGIALHTTTGRPAGRMRSGLRAVLAWLPLLLGAAPMWIVAGESYFRQGPSHDRGVIYSIARLTAYVAGFGAKRLNHMPVIAWTATALLAVFALGVIVAVSRPERGWQDRIAGTKLVPR